MNDLITIGLLGGTFDPPHSGHLNLALSALATGQVVQVWLLPAAQPPHKDRTDIAPAPLRLEMARLLAAADPRLTACDIELTLPAPSYTVRTLRHLQTLYPQNAFRLLIGADMAECFGTWREAEEILRLAPPLVAVRPGFPLPADFGHTLPANLSPESRRILAAGIFPLHPVAAASSDLRAALTGSAEARAAALTLLPPVLADFISKNNLYRNT